MHWIPPNLSYYRCLRSQMLFLSSTKLPHPSHMPGITLPSTMQRVVRMGERLRPFRSTLWCSVPIHLFSCVLLWWFHINTVPVLFSVFFSLRWTTACGLTMADRLRITTEAQDELQLCYQLLPEWNLYYRVNIFKGVTNYCHELVGLDKP